MSVGQVVARNSMSGVFGQLALKVLGLAYTILIVRQLGDHNYGEYATVTALVGIFAVFADLGMANYAVREIAKNHDRAPQLFANMVVLRIILALLVSAMNVGWAVLLGYDIDMLGLVALASVPLFFYSIQGPLNVVLQGFERIDYTASLNVLGQTVLIAVGAVLVWFGWGAVGVIIASCCGVLANMLVAWRLVRGLTPLGWQIEPSMWLPLIKAGLPFGISTFATMLSFKVDIVMLERWRGAAEVGWYNAAYVLIASLLLFSSSFNSALVPSLTRQYQLDPESVGAFYLRAVRMLWCVGLPIAVGGALVSHPLINLLYGNKYAGTGYVLPILIWVLPVLLITAMCGAITSVLHREKATARINFLNACFNIALNLWAIPRYGLFGAAVMTVATEFLGLAQYSFLLRDAFPLKDVARALLAAVPAALVMAGVIVLLGDLPVLLIIAIAAVVYATALLLTGGLKIDELKLLFGTIGAGLSRRRVSVSK